MSDALNPVAPQGAAPTSTRRRPLPAPEPPPGLTPAQAREHQEYYRRVLQDLYTLRTPGLPSAYGGQDLDPMVQGSHAHQALQPWDSARARRQDGRLVISDPMHEMEVWEEGGATQVQGWRRLVPADPGVIRRVQGFVYRDEEGVHEVCTSRTYENEDDAEPVVRESLTRGPEGFVRQTAWNGRTATATVGAHFDPGGGTRPLQVEYDHEDLRESRQPDGSVVTRRRLSLGQETVFESEEVRLPDGNRRGSWQTPDLRKEYRIAGGGSLEHEEATYTAGDRVTRVTRDTEDGRSRTVSTMEHDGRRLTGERVEDGGHSQEVVTFESGPHRTVTCFQDGQRVSRETVSTVHAPTEADVPGLSLLGGHAPQHLVDRLGNPAALRTDDLYTSQMVDGEDGARFMPTVGVRRMVGENGHEVHQIGLGNGGRLWEYRVPRRVGGRDVYDSQVFFQGSDSDTITTRHTQEDGWLVRHSHAHLPERAERDFRVPRDQEQWHREKSGASMDDVRGLVDRGGRLGLLGGADRLGAYREFETLAGRGRLRIEVDDSTADHPDGRLQQGTRVVVTTEAGDRLILTRDPENGSLVARLQRTEPGPDGTVDRMSVREGGETTEFSVNGRGEGTMARFGRDGRPLGEPAPLRLNPEGGLPEGVAPVDRHRSTHGISGARTVTNVTGSTVVNGVRVWNWLGDPNRLGRAMNRLPGVGRMTRVASGAAAVTGMIAMAADLREGNMHALVRDAGATSLSGSVMARAMRFHSAARFLGAGGGALGVGSGLNTMLEGEYVSGGLEAAGGAFSIMGAVGAGTWAGPVGVGMAVACVLVQSGWEYHKDVRLAPLQLD